MNSGSFEVRAYVGRYRQSGFMCYKSAAAHAQEQADKEGQPFEVTERVVRCIIRPTKQEAKTDGTH